MAKVTLLFRKLLHYLEWCEIVLEYVGKIYIVLCRYHCSFYVCLTVVGKYLKSLEEYFVFFLIKSVTYENILEIC